MVRRCTEAATDRDNNDDENLAPNIIQILIEYIYIFAFASMKSRVVMKRKDMYGQLWDGKNETMNDVIQITGYRSRIPVRPI
jgi:predicted oxidoreductase (fatty acid repression mutant protein)